MVAISQEMIPPPTITICSGRSRLTTACQECCTTSPSISIPGKALGREPVARITLRALIWRSPTATVSVSPSRPASRASPSISCTLFLR